VEETEEDGEMEENKKKRNRNDETNLSSSTISGLDEYKEVKAVTADVNTTIKTIEGKILSSHRVKVKVEDEEMENGEHDVFNEEVSSKYDDIRRTCSTSSVK